MPTPRTQRPVWWWLPAFIGLAFILFWPTLQWTPFSDDHSALWNSGVRGIPWRTGFFRPLSDLTFRIGYLLGGTEVHVHRSFNVLLHGFNAFLLYVLCRQWSFGTGSSLAGLLFLVYPFHQESIVWLVGRESALGTLSVLLGLVLAGSAILPFLRLLLMAVVLVMGGLCYESALLLFPLALVAAWSGVIPHWTRLRPVIIALGTATIVYVLLRMMTVGLEAGGYFGDLHPRDASALILRIPKAIARLFIPPEHVLAVQAVRVGSACTAVFLLTALILLVHRRKEDRAIRARFIVWLMFLLMALSISVMGGVSTMTSESDRFLHLPSVFLCGVAGLLLSRLKHPFMRWGSFVALVVVCMWGTSLNHRNWRTASTMTMRCIENLPPIPENGHLWVSGLPSDNAGAFIFRNGFPEAMDLNGRNGEGIIVVPSGITFQQVFSSGLHFRGTHRTWGAQDSWCTWLGTSYTTRPSQ
ncbi:MAG: hypothetical protein JNM62_00830 [Flavobacteriales bacterium]|nr:hypothetical protein [Flavobacteriales bacterium]